MTAKDFGPALQSARDDLTSLKVVRESLHDDDLQGALAYLGLDQLPGGSRLFVLVDLDDKANFPVAAVVVGSQGGVWRVDRTRSPSSDAPRLAAELVRLATGAGATQLVSPPPPDSAGGALLRKAPLPASVCNGWIVIDL